MLYYSLRAWQDSSVDDIILVVSEEYLDLVRSDIVEKYGFDKVSGIVCGGASRFDSVYNGLRACDTPDYVFIHDGARPCISPDVIARVREAVISSGACVAAVPVKDTIKVSDPDGFVSDTPARDLLWAVQTPQAFRYDLILEAYVAAGGGVDLTGITDDAMVVERFGAAPVKLVMGDYENFKVTTPEDLEAVKMILTRDRHDDNII